MRRLALILTLALLLATAIACRQQPAAQPQTDALKIDVADTGLYRLSLANVQNAGLAVDDLDVNALALTQAGEPVPYLLADDSLIFYGQASDSRYTALRPYILRSGEAGTTMAATPAPAGDGPTIAQVTRILHLEENYEYVSDAFTQAGISTGIGATTDQAPWFWQTIQLQSSISLDFQLPPVADGAGRVQANLYGSTHNPNVEGDHSVTLLLNEQDLGTFTWEGQTLYTGTLDLPAGSLHGGNNTLVLENTPEEYVDIMKLNWLSFTYNAAPTATGDWLDFQDGDGTVSLDGFSDRPLIFDVADPDAPVQLTDWVYDDGAATLGVAGAMHVAAVGPDGFRSPAGITSLRQNGWRDDERQADLIILTTGELAPALEPLVAAREEQGLSVALVPVEDVYDEFGHGAATPDSIRNFVTYAYEEWSAPSPRYLFLVGDATSDYRGYLASRPENPVTPPQNIIPPVLVPVRYGGETVSDARLADVDGDLKPELAVGRWPADNPDAVRALVERTLAYEAGEGTVPGRAIFAADGTSDEFKRVTERILERSQFPDDQTEFLNGPRSAQVAETWNQGAWLVTYTGHGSLALWGKDDVFSTDTIGRLNSNGTPPPIVLQLTCLSGLYAHPETTSLSEQLLAHEDGPVLLVGATSLTLSTHQEPFAVRFLEGLQDDDVQRIGDAFQQAKEDLDVSNDSLREISDTFSLFGDPSTQIMRPQ